jgi:multiple sugar transport system ATP-binding protein
VLTSGREGVEEGTHVVMTVADTDVHVFAAGDGDTPRLGPVDHQSTLEAAQ